MNNVNLGKKPITDLFGEDAGSTAPEGILVNQLGPDDELSITTMNNTYHVTVIDPETAQVRVRGGIFRSDTIADIAGSSSYSSFKPFGIYVGHCIEFLEHARRIRTSPVRVIRLLARSENAA